MITLNDKNFKSEVLESSTPVLVDFWSMGCGPCRALEPILKAVDGKVGAKIGKIEPVEGMEAFTTHRVSHVPTMIIFKEGKEVSRKTGVLNEAQLTEWVKANE